uniref:BICD family like cargo adaptor 1 n=1 Tax=Nothoprocta perdicaria TaxID=30464 RepID=A0A8C6Z9G3_NOTPE
AGGREGPRAPPGPALALLAAAGEPPEPPPAAAARDPELLSLIRQKEKDLVLAARLGKALLERNQDMSRQYERMHKELTDKLEQEKHELRRRFENREGEWEGRVSELESDVKQLQDELEKQQVHLREADREKTRAVQELSEQNQRLLDQLSRVSQAASLEADTAALGDRPRGKAFLLKREKTCLNPLQLHQHPYAGDARGDALVTRAAASRASSPTPGRVSPCSASSPSRSLTENHQCTQEIPLPSGPQHCNEPWQQLQGDDKHFSPFLKPCPYKQWTWAGAETSSHMRCPQSLLPHPSGEAGTLARMGWDNPISANCCISHHLMLLPARQPGLPTQHSCHRWQVTLEQILGASTRLWPGKIGNTIQEQSGSEHGTKSPMKSLLG